MLALTVYTDPNEASIKSQQCVLLHSELAFWNQRCDVSWRIISIKYTNSILCFGNTDTLNIPLLHVEASCAHVYHSLSTSKVAKHPVCVIENMLNKKIKSSGKGFEANAVLNFMGKDTCSNSSHHCFTMLVVPFTQTSVPALWLPIQSQNHEVE